MAKYVNREIEPLIKKAFKQFPALILTGARQCGKSTLIKELFPKIQYITFDKLNLRNFALNDPEGFLDEYAPPVIIDEIQECPEILSYIKARIDANKKPGMYLITGSQQFSLMEGVQESLAGRAAVLDLATFNINETLTTSKACKDWSEFVFMGSYPECVTNKKIDRDLWYSSYIRTFIERDVAKQLKEENIYNYEKFIALLAARCSQEINYSSISKELGVSIKTLQTWMSFLVRSQIVFLLKPYHNNLGKRITKSPKLYFYDSGLVAYLTGHDSAAQIKKGPLKGELFENLIISEAQKQNYLRAQRKNLFFFKENNGLEIDLIVDDPLQPHLIEIKSSATINHNMLSNLLKLRELFDKSKQSLVSASQEEPTMKSVKLINFLNFKV